VRHDFVYCPGCRRYSVVHWQGELDRWECEDCLYMFPKEDEAAWTSPVTLG
jgi:hypothetical protein